MFILDDVDGVVADASFFQGAAHGPQAQCSFQPLPYSARNAHRQSFYGPPDALQVTSPTSALSEACPGALRSKGAERPGGAADDSDGDGVCDSEDRCPGFDDGQDADSDSIPDGCDICEERTLAIELINALSGGQTALLENPQAIVRDRAGDLYIAGGDGDNVLRLRSTGEIEVLIDVTGDGEHQLQNANALAVDSAGNVYVKGGDSHNAFRITPSGLINQVLGSDGDGAGQLFEFPSAVAVDPFDNVFLAGESGDNVFKLTPTGELSVILDATGDGVNEFSDPNALAVDQDGKVYVTSLAEDSVVRVDPDGTLTEIIDLR